jgi:hypothetical protein
MIVLRPIVVCKLAAAEERLTIDDPAKTKMPAIPQFVTAPLLPQNCNLWRRRARARLSAT